MLHFLPVVGLLVPCLTSLCLEFGLYTIGLVITVLLTPNVGCRAQHELMNICELLGAVAVEG